MDATRQEILAATPPSERSEVAARYDAQKEIDTLTQESPEIRAQARARLLRARLVEALVEDHGPYDLHAILKRLDQGMPSTGMQAVVEAARARVVEPSWAEVDYEALSIAYDRKEYLRKRYGVIPAGTPAPIAPDTIWVDTVDPD